MIIQGNTLNNSGSVGSFALPDAPAIGTASVASGSSANVGFTIPASSGGLPVLYYTATSNNGISATGASSPITITGLTRGNTYTFTVTTTTRQGTSLSSAPTSSVLIATVPDAPTIGTATTIDATSANVAFTAPVNNGGLTITSYTAVSSPGGITATLNQSGSGTINVTGLSSTTNYTFTVYETSSYGNSANSSPSNSIRTN